MKKKPDKAVIILEDDEDIAELLSQLIHSYGASPFICATEEEVMTAASSSDTALILLDIMLPTVDGRNVAKSLRKRGVNFPLYFMTGISANNISAEHLALADGILQKPFPINDLRAILDKTLMTNSEIKGKKDNNRRMLELMTTIATEQESIRRHQSRLQNLVATVEQQGLSEQFGEFGMAVEASLERLASRLDKFLKLVDSEK